MVVAEGKELRYFLLCINVIYLSLWHSLPSAAAVGVSHPKSGYVGERWHEGEWGD